MCVCLVNIPNIPREEGKRPVPVRDSSGFFTGRNQSWNPRILEESRTCGGGGGGWVIGGFVTKQLMISGAINQELGCRWTLIGALTVAHLRILPICRLDSCVGAGAPGEICIIAR